MTIAPTAIRMSSGSVRSSPPESFSRDPARGSAVRAVAVALGGSAVAVAFGGAAVAVGLGGSAVAVAVGLGGSAVAVAFGGSAVAVAFGGASLGWDGAVFGTAIALVAPAAVFVIARWRSASAPV